MRLAKIKEVGKVYSGSTPKTSDGSNWGGEICWLTPADLKKENNWYIKDTPRKITEKGFNSANLTMLPVGTVVLTTRAPIGKVALAGVELCTNQGFKNIVCNQKLLEPEFLYYFLTTQPKQLNQLGRGATFKEISKKIVEEFQIPLPSLATQKKIVALLDGAQSLIDKRKQQIALLDELIKSTFYTMFGDPVTNPMGWEKKALTETCDIVTGNTPSRKNPLNFGDFIEWIKSDNINTPNTYLTTADEYLSEEGLKKGRFVDANTILMTCIAGSINCIGNVAIADRKVAFNQQINALIPKEYNLVFLYQMILLSKSVIRDASNNSMKGMLSKGKLGEVRFVFPPITIQTQFAEKVHAIEAQKANMRAGLAAMEELFGSLMQRSFSGEIQ